MSNNLLDLAEVISKNNVGGVVQLGSTAIGLPKDVWGKHDIGLIPSKQSTRLAIAKVLEDLKVWIYFLFALKMVYIVL